MRLNSRARGAGLICVGLITQSGAAWAQNWWIEVGPVFRADMKAKAEGSSYTQMLGLHDPMASGPLSTPPGGIGAANAYGDRVYDNGYVKLDPGTGNPNSIDPNTTWNWGFDQASQYNAAAQTLSFQKQGAPGYNALLDGPPGNSDKFWGGGFQIVAGLPLAQSGDWNLDLTFGFQALWGGTEKFNVSTYREEVLRPTITDVYDVSGIGAANFPSTFHGTYLGPFDTPPIVPSPVIPNLPQSRSTGNSAPLSTSYNNVGFDIDQDLYQLSLGPQVGVVATDRVKLHARPTISLNIIDAGVKRTETFVQMPAGGSGAVLGQWYDRASRQEIYLGLGAIGGIDVDLGKGYYASVFGGYEWVAEHVGISVGPSKVSLDASGWAAGLSVGKRF